MITPNLYQVWYCSTLICPKKNAAIIALTLLKSFDLLVSNHESKSHDHNYYCKKNCFSIFFVGISRSATTRIVQSANWPGSYSRGSRYRQS